MIIISPQPISVPRRIYRAGPQWLHQPSDNTFHFTIFRLESPHNIVNPISVLLVCLLQVFLRRLQKSSTLDRLVGSYTSWYQSHNLEANTKCCLHAQTRLAEGMWIWKILLLRQGECFYCSI